MFAPVKSTFGALLISISVPLVSKRPCFDLGRRIHRIGRHVDRHALGVEVIDADVVARRGDLEVPEVGRLPPLLERSLQRAFDQDAELVVIDAEHEERRFALVDEAVEPVLEERDRNDSPAKTPGQPLRAEPARLDQAHLGNAALDVQIGFDLPPVSQPHERRSGHLLEQPLGAEPARRDRSGLDLSAFDVDVLVGLPAIAQAHVGASRHRFDGPLGAEPA